MAVDSAAADSSAGVCVCVCQVWPSVGQAHAVHLVVLTAACFKW